MITLMNLNFIGYHKDIKTVKELLL